MCLAGCVLVFLLLALAVPGWCVLAILVLQVAVPCFGNGCVVHSSFDILLTSARLGDSDVLGRMLVAPVNSFQALPVPFPIRMVL